jgi:GrpB-like predicted nucleotidyltransferase (UPF0157 family)
VAVCLKPHDEQWSLTYDIEARRIRRALGPLVVRLHHVGGTAIAGIVAQPIIDIAMEIADLAALDANNAQMKSLGYEAKGEFGIPGRRYFRRDDETGARSHHVHAFVADDEQVRGHVAFRDYLIAHPQIARLYGQLKERLARQFPDDINAYADGKSVFIAHYQAKALEWRASQDAKWRPSSVTEFIDAAERLSPEDLARVVRLLDLIRVASQTSKEQVAVMMGAPVVGKPSELRRRLDEVIAFLQQPRTH